MFWVLLALVVSTFFINQLLAPKPKGAVSNTNAVQPPTAEKGTPVPVVFGTCKIAANVTWYGNVRAQTVTTITGNRTLLNPFAVNHSQVTGYRYGADIAGALCHGPIDELVDVWFQDTSMLRYNQANANYVAGAGGGAPVLTTPMSPNFPQVLPANDNPVTYSFNAPDLFGGDSQEGGVVGSMQFFYGKMTQVASTMLAAKLGAAVSRYKGICHFIIYDALFGTSPYLKNMFFVVRRCPQVVSTSAAMANINGSANAADVIWEIMTDQRWGLGLSPAKFDKASFIACATTLKAEGMGLDFVMNSQDAADAAVGEVLRHIDGVVFSHPQTGLITLKLARADYDVATLQHVTTSNAVNFTNFKRSTWPETFNEVRCTFLNRGTAPYLAFTNDVAPAQNLANLQATGQVASADYDFPYFSSYDVALAAAFRTLRVVSVPLASGQLVLSRSLFNLTLGSTIILDWAPLGVSGLVMRVVDIKFGTLESNQIEATVIEDVFNTAPVVYTAPSPTAWLPPVTTAVVPAKAVAIPAPYYLTKADQFVGLNLVIRGNKASVSWDGTYNNASNASDSPIIGTVLTSQSLFCPAGTLDAIYPWNTAYQDEAGFLVNNTDGMENLLGTDAAGLARGDLLAYIMSTDGGEIIAWRDITVQSSGKYLLNGIIRGQFDTVPVDHKAGDTIFFFYPTGYTPYYPGQEVVGSSPPTASSETLSSSGYKMWPAVRGITTLLPPGPPIAVIAPPATNNPQLDPRRAVMPLPVGDTRLNGTKNNAIVAATPLPDSNSVSWLHRNRLFQTTPLPHDYPDVSPETGETYEVEVRHVSRTTGLDIFGVLRTLTAISASPFTYTNQLFETDLTAANGGTPLTSTDVRRTGGGIRFLIRTLRAGMKSYDLAVPGFTRKQLTGNPIVPSLQFANIYVAPVITTAQIDQLYLQAWYSADEATNVLTGTRIDTLMDKGTLGRNLTRSAGTPTKNPAQINGLPSMDLTGAEYFSNLSLSLEGGMTFFAVMKYSNIGAYHNFFDTLATGYPAVILWIDGSGLMEPDAESNSGLKYSTAAVWAVVVIHNSQAGSKLGFKLRVNGTQVTTDNGGTTASGTIPGGIGTPASFVMTMFNRSGANGLHAQVAEFGFYGRSKDGSELPMEAYLLDKYGFIPAMDTTNLKAWYAADSNSVSIASTKVASFNDKSGLTNTLYAHGTNIVPTAATLNGRQVATFATPGDYLSNIVLNLEGGMTFFAVFKITSSSANQVVIDPVSANLPNCQIIWDQPTNKWQADGATVGTAVAGAWVTMVVHCYNTGGNAQMKVRVNGALISTAAMTTTGVPMPGAPGVPVAATLSMFNRATGLFPFTSQVAEFGFYSVSKDGSEAALEAYLRAKYKTW